MLNIITASLKYDYILMINNCLYITRTANIITESVQNMTWRKK